VPSLKHTTSFKYRRHSKVFDNIEYQVNIRELGRFIRQLKAPGEHIELRSPKPYHKTSVTKDRTGRIIQRATRTCFTQVWYTRKELGAKNE